MIVSFSSLKGGLGKTSTCANLGYILATNQRPKKVLVVDLDPQAGLTHHLSGKFQKKFKASLHDVLKGTCEIGYVIHEYKKNMDCIPVSYKLYEVTEKDFEIRLEASFNTIKDKYDFILFDLPPSVHSGTLVPLMISDYIIIPVDCQGALSILGLQTAEKIIRETMEKNKTKTLDLLGILPTFLDRTKVSKEVLEFLKKNYGEYVFPPIRRNTAIAQASSLGKTIFEHRSKSIGSQDYLALSEEFLRRTEREKR